MSYAERHEVSLTTGASGDATGRTPTITGRIINVIYTKPGSGGFDNGVDFTITLEETEQNVWTEADVNASKTVAPRQATHAEDGSASLYAAGGEPVEDYIVAAKDKVKIVVANGGDTKQGAFTVIVA